jgi:DNA-binding CsgD family transcriptional regulator
VRRVVIELPRKELLPEETIGLGKIESFRVINLLRQDSNTYAGVCSVVLRPHVGLADLIGVVGFTRIQLLSEEIDGSLTVLVEGRRRRGWVRPRQPAEGYLYPPFELEGEKWRMTFFGTEAQVRKNLAALDKRGLHYHIVYSGDARFESTSLLSALTEKQRQVIMTAYSKGYFDFPRRIKSRELADLLGIKKPTLVQHLRKAEKTILDSITSGNPTAIPARRFSGKRVQPQIADERSPQ